VNRAARVAGSLGFDRGIAGVRVGIHADLGGAPALVLTERDEAARREVEHRGGQRPAGRAAGGEAGDESSFTTKILLR